MSQSKERLLTALFPEYLWYEGSFHSEHAVLMSESQILAVDTRSNLEDIVARRRAGGQCITYRRLPRKALLPGFVNTHSHAFQRAIRGRTEFPSQALQGEQNFWSWREIMYRAAEQMSPADIEAIAQAVFVEMVKTGITRVGEFHYLHHQFDGEPYEEADELALRVLSGAQSAGIKVTLLRSFYERAGIGRPEPEGAQRIFCDPSVEYYLESLRRLSARGVEVGVTAHSVRAVTRDGLVALLDYAKEHALPFHIHVSEQQKELAESVEEYGMPPVEFLASLNGLTESTTLVHAIHLSQSEVESIGAAKCFIASCPTTERNLGDGIVKASALLKAGAKFTFGTDSQCQIFLPEDARQLEYHLRLQQQNRAVLFADGATAAREFLKMMTLNGARSLGQNAAGALQVGYQSDMFSVSLDHLSLAGSSLDSLALDLVFSASQEAVADVWINGAEIVTDGRHRAEKQAQTNLRRVLQKLRK